jgi:hypothetical protein
MQYEEEMEMDKSPLPNDLSMAISDLYDILVRMAQEESTEFNQKDEMKMSDNIKDLSKYDAQDAKTAITNSENSISTVAPQQSPKFDDVTSEVNAEQRDQVHPKEINDLFASVAAMKARLVARGYIDDEKIIKPTSMQWGEKSDKTDDLAKFMGEIKDQLTGIADRMEKIENQPLPAKGALKEVSDSYSVISKNSDLNGKELAKVDRNAFNEMRLQDKELSAMDIIKSIHTGKI